MKQLYVIRLQTGMSNCSENRTKQANISSFSSLTGRVNLCTQALKIIKIYIRLTNFKGLNTPSVSGSGSISITIGIHCDA